MGIYGTDMDLAVDPRELSRFAGPWEPEFEARVMLAAECLDCKALPRDKNAGRLIKVDGDWFQVMHNGILTLAGGHYGDWTVDLIARCGGVHEPQEERVFYEILKQIRPGAVMVELGCYWAYYGIWFAREVEDARLVLIEPIKHRREVAKRNLDVNRIEAILHAAAIGEHTLASIDFQNGLATASGIEQLAVDELLERFQVPVIDLLHVDIQGFEYAMLRGAADALHDHRIKYIFISTHRWLEEGLKLDLHQTCRDRLTNEGYIIFAEHTPEESFTVDGLLVAHSPDVGPIQPVNISLRYNESERVE